LFHSQDLNAFHPEEEEEKTENRRSEPELQVMGLQLIAVPKARTENYRFGRIPILTTDLPITL
jgi:hypothetical protein